jgi:hypothetical protein
MRPDIGASSAGESSPSVGILGGAVVQVRRCDVDRYVQCDWVRRPRSFPNVILEDTRDLCPRDVQLVEQN